MKNIFHVCKTKCFFTAEEECFKLTSCDGKVQKETVEELCSSQKEADTKMFLCAKFASDLGYSEICFHTFDTEYSFWSCIFR